MPTANPLPRGATGPELRSLEVRVDLEQQRLWRDGESVHVEPRVWDLLAYLIARPQRVVGKQELLDAIWPDVAVAESSLSTVVRKLRNALGDSANEPRYLRTVHRRGLEWTAPVEDLASSAAVTPTAQRSFVGRVEELERLRGALELAAGGSRQVVFIEAEAGWGKTGLVEEFLASDGSDAVVASAQCREPLGVAEPYLPILEAISQLAVADPVGVGDVLRRFAPDWLAQLPWLADGSEPIPPPAAGTGDNAAVLSMQLAKAIESSGGNRPLIVVLEDLHWSDESTFRLFRSLASRKEAAKLLMIATYRPTSAVARDHPVRTLARQLQTQPHVARIQLGALTLEDTDEFLHKRGVEPEAATALSGPMVRVGEGNPLYLTTLVDHLIEREWLRSVSEADGRLALTAPVTAIDFDQLPSTLVEIIEVQLEALAEDEIEVLETASVVGVQFSVAILAHAGEQDEIHVETLTERIMQRSPFVRAARQTQRAELGSAGADHEFAHALYRRVLYDRIGRARRRRLHQRVGEFLEALPGQSTTRMLAELVGHFSVGEDWMRAAQHGFDLGHSAQLGVSQHEIGPTLELAVSHVERAAPSFERSKLEIKIRIGIAMEQAVRLGSEGEDSGNIDRLLAACEDLPNTAASWDELFLLGQIQAARRRIDLLHPLADRVMAIGKELAEPYRSLSGHWLKGEAEFHDGRCQETLDILEDVLPLCDAEVPAEMLVTPAQTMLWPSRVTWVRRLWMLALSFRGRLQEAKALALELALRSSHVQPLTVASALLPAAETLVQVGLEKEAIEAARNGQRLATEVASPSLVTAYDTFLWAHAADAQDPARDDTIHASYAEGIDTGYGMSFPFNLLHYLTGCLRKGEYEKGLRLSMACARRSKAPSRTTAPSLAWRPSSCTGRNPATTSPSPLCSRAPCSGPRSGTLRSRCSRRASRSLGFPGNGSHEGTRGRLRGAGERARSSRAGAGAGIRAAVLCVGRLIPSPPGEARRRRRSVAAGRGCASGVRS